MKAVVIPDVKKDTLRNVVLDNVEPGSVVSTDELYSYNLLTGDGFTHGAVKHGAKEYAHYDYRTGETFHVNTVEGFWRLFKASIRSTHVQISSRSEEHTSELQSLMRSSYPVFCLKTKKN